jgi:hypothetical protein
VRVSSIPLRAASWTPATETAAPEALQQRRVLSPRLTRAQLLGTTTPGRLRLRLLILVSLCLAWGALAGWVVSQRSSAASEVVSTSAAVSRDGQQIYRSLSDADASAATAFLAGGLEPQAIRHRYQSDITLAARRLSAATSAAGRSAAARDLSTLSAGLAVYVGEIETARADNRIGLPLGAAYLRAASSLMRGTLLPAARRVSATADAQLAAAAGTVTSQPYLLLLLIAAVIVGYALVSAQRWLARRTHRSLNLGLLAATAAGVASVAWLFAALLIARGDLAQAEQHGAHPVSALARAEVAALRARADESLTLIDAGGDDSFQADFSAVQRLLGPGPGSLLTSAQISARGSPADDAASAAAGLAPAWYAAHRTVRSLDDHGRHRQAIIQATVPGSTHSGTLFLRLDTALNRGIAMDEAFFTARAASGQQAFAGLLPGIIVLSLIMAAGCVRGIGQRLAEYR